jgi:hypothetical protein
MGDFRPLGDDAALLAAEKALLRFGEPNLADVPLIKPAIVRIATNFNRRSLRPPTRDQVVDRLAAIETAAKSLVVSLKRENLDSVSLAWLVGPLRDPFPTDVRYLPRVRSAEEWGADDPSRGPRNDEAFRQKLAEAFGSRIDLLLNGRQPIDARTELVNPLAIEMEALAACASMARRKFEEDWPKSSGGDHMGLRRVPAKRALVDDCCELLADLYGRPVVAKIRTTQPSDTKRSKRPQPAASMQKSGGALFSKLVRAMAHYASGKPVDPKSTVFETDIKAGVRSFRDHIARWEKRGVDRFNP